MNNKNVIGLFSELFKFDTSDNIVGVGCGHKYVRGENTGEEAITILVKKKFAKSDLHRNSVLPKKMNGVSTDVMEVGDIRLLGERTEYHRPAQPGMSIGHYKVSAGTFGAVVKDRSTGEPLILSNNHVLANITNGSDGHSSIGDPILQPGIYDGGSLEATTIGHLRRFVPLYREVVRPQCKIAQLFETLLNKCVHIFQPRYRVHVMRESERLNLVDCAVATPVSLEAINAAVLDFGLVAGVKEPQLGMEVKKSGRSTGVTYSQVLATDVTFKININNQEYGIFADQILAGPMSMPGDSGSLILTTDNHAVGLLFAGSDQVTMFNRITHVLDNLNIVF